MKIANIVTSNKVDVSDDINVVKSLDDIIEGINVPSNPQMKQLNFTLSNWY